jgi:hypothetical protein
MTHKEHWGHRKDKAGEREQRRVSREQAGFVTASKIVKPDWTKKQEAVMASVEAELEATNASAYIRGWMDGAGGLLGIVSKVDRVFGNVI